MEAKEFGVYIRGLRKNKEMTIRQLELYSGVSNSYMSQLENGKRGIPSPDILKKLSSGLKVDYNTLMIKAGYMSEAYDKCDEELEHFINNVRVWYKKEPETKKERLKTLEEMFEVLKKMQ